VCSGDESTIQGASNVSNATVTTEPEFRVVTTSNYAMLIFGTGEITGGTNGIRAESTSSGTIITTTTGHIEGTTGDGISAQNHNGTDISVTTGSVTGGQSGIRAENDGDGVLTVNTYGNVRGTSYDGIFAENHSTNLNVATGAKTEVTGGRHGVYAHNTGDGVEDNAVKGRFNWLF
jgi:hypothetical protein